MRASPRRFGGMGCSSATPSAVVEGLSQAGFGGKRTAGAVGVSLIPIPHPGTSSMAMLRRERLFANGRTSTKVETTARRHLRDDRATLENVHAAGRLPVPAAVPPWPLFHAEPAGAQPCPSSIRSTLRLPP